MPACWNGAGVEVRDRRLAGQTTQRVRDRLGAVGDDIGPARCVVVRQHDAARSGQPRLGARGDLGGHAARRPASITVRAATAANGAGSRRDGTHSNNPAIRSGCSRASSATSPDICVATCAALQPKMIPQRDQALGQRWFVVHGVAHGVVLAVTEGVPG